MTEDGKIKIDNMMVLISVFKRCRSKTLYNRRSFRSLWQMPNLQNTVKDRIMDSSASFHATYCKEELERFKLHFGKVRLADDKTLNIASIKGCYPQNFFWYKLDSEGCRIGMNMLASKGNVPDVRKVDIYFCKPGGLGKHNKLSFIISYGRYNVNLLVKCLKFDNRGKYSSCPIKFCVENGIVMLKMVLKTPLQFGVVKRLSRTFRAESTGLRAEMKCDTTFGIRRVTRLSEAEILHLWTQFMEPAQYIVLAVCQGRTLC
nr:hypothetical protein [Tanacetum cinerariifolium]